MLEQDIDVLSEINAIVDRMNTGLPVKYSENLLQKPVSPYVQKLADSVLKLAEQYNESYAYMRELSRGHLDITPPICNGYSSMVKQLQSDLKHLNWQIQEIANGDYEQNVSFAGEFSISLNKMIHSLREREQLFELNKANEQLFHLIFQLSPDGMMITGINGEIQMISSSAKKICGLKEEDITPGLNIFDLINFSDREKVISYYERKLKKSDDSSIEFSVYRQDNSEFWIELSGAFITDSDNKPKALFIIFRDVTRRKENEIVLKKYAKELDEANKKLKLLSITDSLTQTYNRRQFDLQFGQEVSRVGRYGGCFSLLMLDLDRFKELNDTYGHIAGDTVLFEVASNIKKMIRKVDMVFRYGGEEFVIILPNTLLADSIKVAENIRSAIESISIPAGDENVRITASLGVACSQDCDDDSTCILEKADKALYIAKYSGRNCVMHL